MSARVLKDPRAVSLALRVARMEFRGVLTPKAQADLAEAERHLGNYAELLSIAASTRDSLDEFLPAEDAE